MGQLVVIEELIPLEQCRQLRAVIRAHASAGRPTSMGRLLLKGGLKSKQLRALPDSLDGRHCRAVGVRRHDKTRADGCTVEDDGA